MGTRVKVVLLRAILFLFVVKVSLVQKEDLSHSEDF
jgi:hypothetical protein